MFGVFLLFCKHVWMQTVTRVRNWIPFTDILCICWFNVRITVNVFMLLLPHVDLPNNVDFVFLLVIKHEHVVFDVIFIQFQHVLYLMTRSSIMSWSCFKLVIWLGHLLVPSRSHKMHVLNKPRRSLAFPPNNTTSPPTISNSRSGHFLYDLSAADYAYVWNAKQVALILCVVHTCQ